MELCHKLMYIGIKKGSTMVSFKILKTLRDGYRGSRTIEELIKFETLETDLKNELLKMQSLTKDVLLHNRIGLHLRNLDYIASLRELTSSRLSKGDTIEIN